MWCFGINHSHEGHMCFRCRFSIPRALGLLLFRFRGVIGKLHAQPIPQAASVNTRVEKNDRKFRGFLKKCASWCVLQFSDSGQLGHGNCDSHAGITTKCTAIGRTSNDTMQLHTGMQPTKTVARNLPSLPFFCRKIILGHPMLGF